MSGDGNSICSRAQDAEIGAILAQGYIRLLSQRATKPQTTGHLAGAEDSSETASEVAIAVGKTSVMSPEARQDGGRNANPSKELR